MSRESQGLSLGRLLVLSLFCSFAVAWLTGCSSESEGPVTAETSQYQVGDGETPDGESATVHMEDRDTGAGTPASKGDATSGTVTDDPLGTIGMPGDPSTLPSQPRGAADIGQLPDGKDALLALLDELQNRQPRGRTQQEFQDFVNVQRTRIEAAQKLYDTSSDKEARNRAVQAKLDSMRMLNRMGVPDIDKQIHAYCRTLQKQEDADIALMARLMLFAMAIDQLAAGKVDDEQAILDELKSLVKAGPEDAGVFLISSQAAGAMHDAGFRDSAAEAFRLIGNAYKDNTEPEVAAGARAMIDRATLAELDFDNKLKAMMEGRPDAVAPVKEVLQTLLSQESPGELPLGVAAHVAQTMEMDHHYQDLAEVQTLIENAYKEHPEKRLADFASSIVDNGRRRAGLIGKPFTVAGKLPDGSQLDWGKYQGKVVLVDFWASWCRPCMAEIPNIEDNLKRYREKGFEVVGVSVDNDVPRLAQILGLQPLPWLTILNSEPAEDPTSREITQALALKCGVDAIPFTVLVGREGNVIAINVRGSRLGEQLAGLFGSATEDAVVTPPANESSMVDPTSGQEVFFVSFQEEAKEEQDEWKEVNPYSPRQGLSSSELVDFILIMQEKPKSIQLRPGFAEAVVEAAGRILAAESKEKQREIAAQAKFGVLHEKACLGDEEADKDLMAFVQEMKEDKNEKIAAEVKFFLLERKVIDVDKMPLDEVPSLLDELKGFFADKKLLDRHLRIASSTVRAINRLEDGDEREKYFSEFGELFAKGDSKELARYGKKLGKKPKVKTPPPDLTGKPLELAGVTALGTEFDWSAYRGKVVLVDFWATWCGPCREAMPQVKALHERLKDQGFDIVGVSLDRSQEALAKYLEENAINWTNLVGKEVREITKKYSIRAVPTMIVVDHEGNVVTSGNKIAELTPQIEKLIEKTPL